MTIPALRFSYKNHKGEISDRRAQVIRVTHTETLWHPIPQYIMLAFDLDKNEMRSFAMADIIKIYGPDD